MFINNIKGLLGVVLTTLVAANLYAVERTSLSLSDTEVKKIQSDDSGQQDAIVWNLTPEEWSRQQDLMKGIRGRLSDPGISPIEVLGIHARSDVERIRYARMWAKLMYEDSVRVLQFQRAYDAAIDEILQGESLIDEHRLRELHVDDAPELLASDRILIFLTLDCDVCDIVFNRTLKLIQQVSGIDVYFVGVSSQDEIRKWAGRVSLDPTLVARQSLTLNIDQGLLKSLRQDEKEVPYVFRLREGDLSLISTELPR